MMPQWLDAEIGRPTMRAGHGYGRVGQRSTNSDMYMQVNLHDLEAYTNHVLDTERRRRRACYCRVGCALLWIGLLVVGSYTWNQGALLEDTTTNSTLQETAQQFQDFIVDSQDNAKQYPLTSCEVELAHNNSFHNLVQSLNENAPSTKQWHCRQEVPDCNWLNPTIPQIRKSNDRTVMEGWKTAFLENQKLIAMAEAKQKVYDVVLVGASIVEHMAGKELGMLQAHLKRYEDVFETLFSTQGGGTLQGLPLGIAGDRCSNVLYRLQNGELTYGFQPKVWWIIIGSEDWHLGVAPESIVAGIIAIVRSIRLIHSDATIVINSLLPRDHQSNRSIQQANQLLGCYVKSQSLIDEDNARKQIPAPKKHYRRLLHFFNATDIFLEQESDGSYQVNPTLIAPGPEGDPDAHGQFLWGKKMVQTIEQLIQPEG